MNELQLPDQIKGPWENALFFTYGLDLPFFENAIWGQFDTRCKNKIILADGKHFLEACKIYAKSSIIKHLNQQYIAEGIHSPRPAHAKIILLTNAQKGRLLIGSGNLNLRGYASGGELFTQYDYSDEFPQQLNAFLSVREMLDEILNLGFVRGQATRRINVLFEKTPWLMKTSNGAERPVRHNLKRSFLEQLKDEVGNRPVEELVVLTPFYDEELVALKTLVKSFNPARITLLVQPGRTSVDPIALQKVLDPQWSIKPFGRGKDKPYYHAKLFLLKLADQTICLQGSPNLSQVAMLLKVPQGNIEAANLLIGTEDYFTSLLAELDIEQNVTDLSTLSLALQSTDQQINKTPEEWQLTSGEWHGQVLRLNYRGTIPELKETSLVIGSSNNFPVVIRKIENGVIEIDITPEIAEGLSRVVPISLVWGSVEPLNITNPIFVCNVAALNATMATDDDSTTLNRVGGLDFEDDAELELLLKQLDNSLIIDRQSIWQMAGKTPSTTETDDNVEGPAISYADIDHDMLRRHPKIQQYTMRGQSGQGYQRSRLQMILSSITSHFEGLLEQYTSGPGPFNKDASGTAPSSDDEPETEQAAEEKQQRNYSIRQRLQRTFKNFINRYLKGIKSKNFQDFAGPDVISANYVIFSHILWILYSKDWADPEFITKSLLETWRFFWGSDSDSGYFQQLETEQQGKILELLREKHSDAEFLAALYYTGQLSRFEYQKKTPEWEQLRYQLRDFLRHFLVGKAFPWNIEVIEESCLLLVSLDPFKPFAATTAIEEFIKLVKFETNNGFLRGLETLFQLPSGSCKFQEEKIYRNPLGRKVLINCLVIQTEQKLAEVEMATCILQKWISFEKLSYYRCGINNNRVVIYDVSAGEAFYWNAETKLEEPIKLEPEVNPEWELKLMQIKQAAKNISFGAQLKALKTA